jgi:hypothetical protein
MDDFPTAVHAPHGQSIDRATADDKSRFEGSPQPTRRPAGASIC